MEIDFETIAPETLDAFLIAYAKAIDSGYTPREFTIPFVMESERFRIDLRITAKKIEDQGGLLRATRKARRRIQRFASRVWNLKPEEVQGCGCSGS